MALDDIEVMKEKTNKNIEDLKNKGYCDEMIDYIINIESYSFEYTNR